MTAAKRHLALAAAMLATVLAAVFAPAPDGPVQPSHTVSRAHEVTAPALGSGPATTPVLASRMPIARHGLKNEPGDLFLVDKPPPAPVLAHALPPPRVAPPLPYAYMGKMQENGQLTIFLTREDRPYVVHAGDVLDSQYRVDAIKPPLIELTYLPMRQKQLLSMGETK